MPSMELAVTTAFSHRTPIDYIIGAAQRIEAAGFACVWVPEHVLFFPDYDSQYPYSDDGRLPGDPDGVLDPFTSLTFIAANTTTLRLGTGICLVPQRQPVYTAKMVADVDYLSGGRVDFGIGVGWLEEEFDALGVSFADRGGRCDEYIDAMKACWGPDPVSFSGPTVQINNALFNPKPVQQPHPRIFVGGEGQRARRRVAELADGWYGYRLEPDQVTARLTDLDELLQARGRSRDDLAVHVAPNRRITPDDAAAYESVGVDQLILGVFARSLDELDERLGRLNESAGR